ncbi:NAD-dependent deacylase [Desulfonatronum thiosulfatophilum]|uniref:SIR2 family NAD-dependent protein deacylase n=1 Tax=Desulfonatronum thiosulfatophilum TaxID=617002 RepID=UPI003133C331
MQQAADIWQNSRRVIALTGAGISVPSGIPDFRSPGGLWSQFDASVVASTWGLEHNPKAVWDFLLSALEMFEQAKPNPAHLALTRLEQAGALSCVITQNIDGLHQQAGTRNVIEFHGNCRGFYCNGCRREYPAAAAVGLQKADLPWLCDVCRRVIRPTLVFFGEAIPHEALNRSRHWSEQADLVVIIGTSGDVAPANVIPYQVKAQGGRVLEINLGQTAYGNLADVRLDLPAEECLPVLADLLTEGESQSLFSSR